MLQKKYFPFLNLSSRRFVLSLFALVFAFVFAGVIHAATYNTLSVNLSASNAPLQTGDTVGPHGCPIRSGDGGIETCDVDPGSFMTAAGTLSWNSGFSPPLPAMGMGAPGLGYLPSSYPMTCAAGSTYPGSGPGNSNGSSICEISFNSSLAGTGSATYNIYVNSNAVRGNRYLMGLTSNGGSNALGVNFYVRVKPLSACVITSFTADSMTPVYNTGTTLRFNLSSSFPWSIAAIGGGGSPSPTSGTGTGGVSTTGNLTSITTYRLTCGTATQDLTISPTPPANPQCSPLSQTVNPGQSLTFTGTSGDYNYSWLANGGAPGSGSSVGNNSTFTTKFNTAGSYTVQNYDGTGHAGSCAVTVQPTTCTVNNFSATPNPVVTSGSTGVTTLNSSVTCDYDIRVGGPSGSIFASPAAGTSVNTTGNWVTDGMVFYLQKRGDTTSSGTLKTLTVNLASAPSLPVVTLSATPTTGTAPLSSVLTWSTTGGGTMTCAASGGWSGTQPSSGTQNVTTSSNTTYTLTCTNEAGSGSQSVTISPSSSALPSVTLNAAPLTGASPLTTALNWTVSGATSCTASGGWSGSKSITGGIQTIGGITSATTYILSCSNSNGPTAVSVTVVPTTSAPPVPVVSLTASPSTGIAPFNSTLTWSATNSPTSCTASGGWSGTKTTSGNQTMTGITTSTTYTLTCTNSAGTSNPVSVNVAPNSGSDSAQCLSLVAPSSVTAGTSFPVTVTMKNNGTNTWVPTGTNNYSVTEMPYPGTWGPSRTVVPTSVAPGSTVVMSLNATAPASTGSKTLQYQMLHENVAWFGTTCSMPVTVTPLVAPVITFTANPATGATPLTSVLSWSTTNNPTSCTASGGWSGSKSASGNQTMSALIVPTTYTLSCTNSAGTDTKSVTVTPTNSPSAPVVTLTSDLMVGTAPMPTNLRWSSTNNPTSCTASNTANFASWTGSKDKDPGNHFQSISNIIDPTTFTLSCTNNNGTGSKSVTVTPTRPAVPTLNFSASPTTGASPLTSKLTWTVFGSADTCTASGGWSGSKATLTGNQSISGIIYSTVFTLACSNMTGTTTKSVTVTPTGSGPAITINANPLSGNSPLTSVVTWSTTNNPTSCTASGGWSGSKSASGNQTMSGLTVPTTYTLSCTNPGGTDTQSVTVTPAACVPPTTGNMVAPVTANVNSTFDLQCDFGSNLDYIPAPTGCVWPGSNGGHIGSAATFTCTTPATAGNVTYTCQPQNQVGFTNFCSLPAAVSKVVSVVVPITPPVVTINANPTTGNPPLTTNLTWTATGGGSISCNASGGWSGAKAVAGSQNVSGLMLPTTFTLTCTNSAGTNSSSVTVTPTNYTLTVNNSYGGIVTSSDGKINCGFMCSAIYPLNATTTLTESVLSTQWKFGGWTGSCSGTSQTCNLTMNGQKTVGTIFVPQPLIYQEF